MTNEEGKIDGIMGTCLAQICTRKVCSQGTHLAPLAPPEIILERRAQSKWSKSWVKTDVFLGKK